MLYLAGQILAYVLVAMVIGAALAWVFLIAPLRRQMRDGRQDPRPDGADTSADIAEFAESAGSASVSGDANGAPLVAVGRLSGGSSDDPIGELAAAPVDARAQTPAGTQADDPGADPIVGTDGPLIPREVPAPAGTGEPVGSGTPLAPTALAPTAETSRPEGTGAELAVTGPIQLPIGLTRPVEPVAELVDLLRRQRDDSALERADLTARLAVAEQRAAESEQRIFAAERHASTASARVEEIESALRARVEAAARPASAAASPATAAPGTASSAEGSSTAVSPAVAPVSTASEPARQEVWPATGSSVADLVREAEQLRRQLEDAEGRAAKFSSRLAMARTEAEDAQRQAATLGNRLDRHQAEWAAERLSLLGRIARSEGALTSGSSAAQPSDDTGPVASGAAPTGSEPIAASAARRGAGAGSIFAVGSVPAIEYSSAADYDPAIDASAIGYSAAVDYAEIVGTPRARAAARAVRAARQANATDQSAIGAEQVRAADQNNMGAESAVTAPTKVTTAEAEAEAEAEAKAVEAGVDVSTARARPVAVATKERTSAVAGTPVRGGAGPAVPSGQRGATGEQASGGRVVMESLPRWNGLLDPAVAEGDNLKEIVGVGPVIESRLRTLGITTFGQLAEMGDTDVDRLARMLDGFGDRIISDDWVGQAQDLQVRHHGGVY
ncbi:Flap endonuclease-1-like 5' DNA nuclease [Frankia sp. AiPs1]|uniref:hypothetical protein n=1 Tax=Frankia sp. AiPa1 TaxID=573492 RepID=UPI00202AD0ED|nr:hypothetical protein [Frankia sp. AiPa1]MCL9760377.1 hypothetical protein [Frankia sp. AiPa1]